MNPHGPCDPQDFKSCAYTNSATPAECDRSTSSNLNEAPGGFEPPHKGFADLSLTAWVRRHEEWTRSMLRRFRGRINTEMMGEQCEGVPAASGLWFLEVRARALTGTPTGHPSLTKYRRRRERVQARDRRILDQPLWNDFSKESRCERLQPFLRLDRHASSEPRTSPTSETAARGDGLS